MDADNDTSSYVLADNVTTYEYDTPGCLLYKFIIYTVLVGTLCILGLIGNATAFIVFWQDKVKTSTSFLFQGLSFIDIVLLITAIPVYSVTPFIYYTTWFESYHIIAPYVLVYVFPLAFIAQTATIWLTVLVCVNRYIAVCKPYQASRLCTVNQARKQFALVLICSVIYNVPKFAEGHITFNNKTQMMEPVPTALGQNTYYMIIYQNICYTVFMLIVPLLTLTLLNIRLITALKEIRKRRAEMQSMRQQQDNNVTLVLIIVVLVFTICQAPALVTQIMWTVLTNSSRMCGGFQYYYSCISNLLVILNSSVNFLIYFFFNQRFRQVLLENICGRKPNNNHNVAYSNVNHGNNHENNGPPVVTNTTVQTNNTNNHTTTICANEKDVVVGDGTNETLL